VKIHARTISATLPGSTRNTGAAWAGLLTALLAAGGFGLVVRRRYRVQESWRER